MSDVSFSRSRRAGAVKHAGNPAPRIAGYGAFVLAFCFISAVVLGLIP